MAFNTSSLSIIILRIALVCCVFVVLGCKQKTEVQGTDKIIFDAESSTPLVQFITDQDDVENKNFKVHIRKITTYAKIPYASLSIEELEDDSCIATSTKVIVLTSSKGLSDEGFYNILSFVAKGGTLFLPRLSEDPKYAFLAGLKPDARYNQNTSATGFSFKMALLPGMSGKSFDNKTGHFGINADNIMSSTTVLATAFNDDTYPAVLKNNLGQGVVVSMNSRRSAQKEERGIYFSALLSGLEHVPYPIANVSSIFLDDFPAPRYHIFKDPIKTEYNLSEADFYHQIWWPDMVALAKQEQLKYTAMLCFDYSNLKTPPFLFTEWEQAVIQSKNELKVIGDLHIAEVLDHDDELGFHGYNHISLLATEWNNPDFMQIALQAAAKKWKSQDYGPLPVTYVPPSNDIDSLGLAAVNKAFPSIKFNSSLYLGDFMRGGYREFDTEPLNTHFFDFPRISSGYILDSNAQYNLQSLYLYTGIWTHFIHPDDVYQTPDANNLNRRGDYAYRNPDGLGWRTSQDNSKGLLPRFQNYLEEMRCQYPFIRFLKVKDAAAITQNWRNLHYQHTTSERNYIVSAENATTTTDNYWFVYSTLANVTSLESALNLNNYRYTRNAFLDGFLYNVKTTSASISVPLPRTSTSANVLSNETEDAKVKSLLEDYKKYTSGEPYFSNIDEEIAYRVGEGNLSEAVALLKQKIAKATTINLEDYKTLYTYFSWSANQVEFYRFLEQEYQTTGSDKLIVVSKKLADENGYPSKALRKVWMERQMALYPEDQRLQDTYNSYFNSTSAYDGLSINQLEDAFLKAKSIEEQRVIIPKLLQEESQIITPFIESKTPCKDSDFNPIASDIAQWYANKGDYEKALAWSQCTDQVGLDIVSKWLSETGDFEFFKERDFKKYIQLMILNNPKDVPQSLINTEPCSLDFEKETLQTIAYLYADQGSYRRAHEWSGCISDFDVRVQLQWLGAMKAVEEMEKVYNLYNTSNPTNNDVTLTMARLYSDLGFISKSWKLASTLPNSEELNALRDQLNIDVYFITTNEKKELLANYYEFFKPEVARELTKQIRLTTNDFLVSQSNILADRLQPTTLTNSLGYGHYSKNGDQHIFGVTQNKPFALQLGVERVGNETLQLYGAYYAYKSRQREGKPIYTLGAATELSDAEKVYFQAEAGISFSKDSLFSSGQLSYKPAITAPGYNLEIYRLRLNIYEEYLFNAHWQIIAALESNYYTDNVVDGLVSTTLKYTHSFNDRNKLSPYVESAGMLGTENYTIGYPYWTIEQRLYGGAGIGYQYKVPDKSLEVGADVSSFFDTFSDSFQRYRANFTMPLFDYLYLNFNAEFYTLKNFYSNNFILGLKYHFKD